MHKTLLEAEDFAQGLRVSDVHLDAQIQTFVIPSFTCIREVKTLLKDTSIKVGAQNMHWQDEGAWTGEVSPLMLLDCGMDMVELGHSERRIHFGETDQRVGQKVASALQHGLIPLICIGETLKQKQAGLATQVIISQVQEALALLSDSQKKLALLFAYEPVWAIGANGIPATSDYAETRHAEIAAVTHKIMGSAYPMLVWWLGQQRKLPGIDSMPSHRWAIYRACCLESSRLS